MLALSAILFFARLGTRALWSSEFRWAEIAREMILTHDYFWPTINGTSHYYKPLGSYWLVAAAANLTGAMNEAAARIPCALAGLLAVALLMMLARRLYGLRIAVIAAFILATSFSFVFFARHASADVETITGELAALALFERNRDRPNGWWVAGLWTIMALTSLTKGLLGFALPLLVIGVYSCLADGWAELARHLTHGGMASRLRWFVQHHRWFFNRHTPIAIAVAATIYYLPFAISHRATGSATGLSMVYHENIKRFFEPFDHRGPVYLYTYVIFALMAPWSVFLPAALIHAHRRRADTGGDTVRGDRFTLVFFWATFIFFTLSGSRRSYYLLPILPAAAILVARTLTTPANELTAWTSRLLKAGFALIVVAVAASAFAFIPPRWFLPQPWAQLPMAPDLPMFALFWLASVAAIGYALRNFTPARATLAAAAAAWLFMAWFFVFAMPAGDSWRGEKPFLLRARRIVGDDAATLVFFRNQRTLGSVFYLGLPKPVPEYQTLPELAAAIGEGHVHWLIVRRREVDKFTFPARLMLGETVYPWDSREHRLNSMVLLQVPAH